MEVKNQIAKKLLQPFNCYRHSSKEIGSVHSWSLYYYLLYKFTYKFIKQTWTYLQTYIIQK